MSVYLVQYGEFVKGITIEAQNEKHAVTQVIKHDLFFFKDFEHELKVFELTEGKRFKADAELVLMEIK
jgi:hypothetical protein